MVVPESSIRSKALIAACSALLMVVASISRAESEPYTVTLDGERLPMCFISMNAEPKTPLEDDLFCWNAVTIPLEGPRHCALSFAPETDGIFRVQPGGVKELCVLSLDHPLPGGRGVGDERLSKLSDAEIGRIRCVMLDHSSADRAKKLSGLAANCCVVARLDKDGRLSSLPAQIRHVLIDDGSEGTENYQALSALMDLRVLSVKVSHPSTFDLATIRNARQLRVLRLSKATLINANALAGLTELRELILEHCTGLKDIEFVKGMTHLRRLNITGAAVNDLRPLGTLAELVSIQADDSKAEHLPEGELPRLLSFSVLGAHISPVAGEAFAKIHPSCELKENWGRPMHQILKRAKGVILGHPEAAEEIVDPTWIAELTSRLRVDERSSRGPAMAEGGFRLTFTDEDKKRILELRLFEGRALAWKAFTDTTALLEPKASEELCLILAQRGESEPDNERHRVMAALAERARMLKLYDELLTQEVRERVLSDLDNLGPLLEKIAPNPEERAERCLRALGCSQRSWTERYPLDLELETILGALPETILAAGFNRAAATPEGLEGTARWLFFEERGLQLSKEIYAEAAKRVLVHALEHPVDTNRRYAIHRLGLVEGTWAIPTLRKALAGTLKEPAAESPPFPYGFIQELQARPRFDPAEYSTPANAALALARLKDTDSAAAISDLAKLATEQDRTCFEQALELLKPTTIPTREK